jgi:hypothetical protein
MIADNTIILGNAEEWVTRIDGEWGRVIADGQEVGWHDFHEHNARYWDRKAEEQIRDKELTRLYHQAFTIGSAKKAVEFLRKAGVIR